MLNKNELSFAIVFQRAYIEKLGYSIFIPLRPVIGYLEELTQVFIDELSEYKYINTYQANQFEVDVCFGNVVSIKKLFKLKELKQSKNKISDFFKMCEKSIWFYRDLDFVSILREDFESKYDVKINVCPVSQANLMTEALLDGRIDSSVYNEEVLDTYIEGDLEKSENEDILPIGQVYDKIRKRVVSQDEPIKKILTSVYKSIFFKGNLRKSNVLIIGPTGVGKTEIIRSIANVFNVPVCIEDMTRYTDTGYKGCNIDDILKDLYFNANEDLDLAQKSILVLDEIDKKASNGRASDDFNKGDVLKSLLKVVEGGVFEVEINSNETISFDTSNLTVIALGAFSSIYNKKVGQTIGFDREIQKVKEKSASEISIKDLEKYGMVAEFLGRFKTIVRMNSLSKEDFVKIMKTSELSVISEYIKELSDLGININISDEMYERIANVAISYGTGARGINTVVDSIFEDILFEVFNDSLNIDTIELGEDILNNSKDYVLRKRKE